jgi:hypothetical protein
LDWNLGFYRGFIKGKVVLFPRLSFDLCGEIEWTLLTLDQEKLLNKKDSFFFLFYYCNKQIDKHLNWMQHKGRAEVSGLDKNRMFFLKKKFGMRRDLFELDWSRDILGGCFLGLMTEILVAAKLQTAFSFTTSTTHPILGNTFSFKPHRKIWTRRLIKKKHFWLN